MNWIKRILWKRKHSCALQRFGWDGKCPGCDKWLHTDQCGEFIKETTWHWIYRCSCGWYSAWFLGGMFPMYDDGKQGWPDWRKP